MTSSLIVSKVVIATLVTMAAVTAVAQTVRVTTKTEVYRRPKPMFDGKRIVTIRRPVVKARTTKLSSLINRTVSPEKVLDLDLSEEIYEAQWLSETGFKVLYNSRGILSMSMWMEGAGAYPDRMTRWVVVDNIRGHRLLPSDLFNDLAGLASAVGKLQKKEIRAAVSTIKKDRVLGETDPAYLFAESQFQIDDLNEFSVSNAGVTFHFDYGFPHAIKALQPDGEFSMMWREIAPFIRRDSLLAAFVR